MYPGDRMALTWKKTLEGISYYASADASGVVCGEAGDDPHGVNSESRCTRLAWLTRDADGERCRHIVRAEFGEDAVAEIDEELEGPADEGK